VTEVQAKGSSHFFVDKYNSKLLLATKMV